MNVSGAIECADAFDVDDVLVTVVDGEQNAGACHSMADVSRDLFFLFLVFFLYVFLLQLPACARKTQCTSACACKGCAIEGLTTVLLPVLLFLFHFF